MTPAHDPGGKVRLALPESMRGGATFSGPGDCYRTMLWRQWGDEGAPYALWIGMNPSTADATADDPTVRREIGFTQRMGLTAYRKANVSAYRCTDPKRLPPDMLRCDENLPTILDAARNAERVILAFGVLKGTMRELAAEIVAVLAKEVPLYCLGLTEDGSPKHPLYLKSTAGLIHWWGWHPLTVSLPLSVLGRPAASASAFSRNRRPAPETVLPIARNGQRGAEPSASKGQNTEREEDSANDDTRIP